MTTTTEKPRTGQDIAPGVGRHGPQKGPRTTPDPDTITAPPSAGKVWAAKPNFDKGALIQRLPDWIESLGGELRWNPDHTRFTATCPSCGNKGGFEAKLDPTEGWRGGCWHTSCTLHGRLANVINLARASYGLDFLQAGLRLSEELGVPLVDGAVLEDTPEAKTERARKREEALLREAQALHDRHIRDAIGEGIYETLLDVFAEAALSMGEDWRAGVEDASPIRLDGDPSTDWRLVLRHLFQPEDRIFNGGRYDSGRPHHARHFRPVSELLAMDHPLGPYVTGGVFPAGCFERKAQHVTTARYRLLEADKLLGREPRDVEESEMNKMLSLALFRWLRDRLGIRFSAIVDTGSKSLHGWIDPDSKQLAWLTRHFGECHPPDWPPVPHPQTGEMLPAIYQPVDAKVLCNPAMIFRLPGAIHEKTGQPARLLYLNPQS